MAKRELWGTRLGLILAMAGNAVGLGNFLRFPVQATQNGGGAFMIPYLAAFLLLGIPLMWAEWTMGRLGGTRGHGTTPYIFHTLWRNPVAKYIGVLGVVLPLGIAIYYVYIESWTMAFAYFSSVRRYWGITTIEPMRDFLRSFQGVASSQYFEGIEWAYLFFLLTMAINAYVLFRGVRSGIETLAKIAMPMLFLFAVGVAVRVATLGMMDSPPPHSIEGGFAFIWNPDLSRLGESQIWLAAAGQIFFTLSLAMGCIQTYASYLRERDDIVVTGFTTALTNECAEVILGSSIAIPVAFAFFGAAGTLAIAQGGAFNLGFAAMPVIFQQIPVGAFFGTLWFGLLFFAGITSSVALMTPAIAFLEDELGWSRNRAVASVLALVFAAGHLIIFGLAHGTLDEMDFWCGTFGLALGALIESVMLFWIYGMDRAWKQMHLGAQRRVPRIFYPVMKYITPLYCLVLVVAWGIQNGWDVLTMKNVAAADRLWIWGVRGLIAGLIALFAALLWRASRRWDVAQPQPGSGG